MKCEIGKGKYEIDGELINDLIESIQMNLSVFYDDHNGPWGCECRYCLKRSTDGISPPPHDDDCEGNMLMKKLLNLREIER